MSDRNDALEAALEAARRWMLDSSCRQLSNEEALLVCTALLATEEARERVIEECAQVVESQHYLSDGFEVWAAHEKTAKAIRDLKSKPPLSVSGKRD